MTTTVQTGSNSETRPLWQLFFGIIDQPTKTFQAILARQSWATWLIPLLVILLCFAVFIISLSSRHLYKILAAED